MINWIVSVWHYEGSLPSRWSLCQFWRETRQRVWTQDLNATRSRRRTPVGSWKKEPREVSWWRARQNGSWQSTPDSRRDQSAWERVQHQWGKTSQDESAFFMALWKFREGCKSALVDRSTKECRVSQLNLLALELTQAHIVHLFFVLSSHSLDCISCAIKKCVMPLSEPLDDNWPRLKWSKEVDVTGGRGGNVTSVT